MAARKDQAARDDLSLARARFDSWRRSRKVGARIPEALWRLAVELTESCSLSQVAAALRLDYYGLKRRVERSAKGRASAPAKVAFVELTAPAAECGQCWIELDDGRGGSLRMRLRGYNIDELAALSQSLRSTP